MARSLTAGMITEVTGRSLSPLLLIKAEFDSADLNLWTGIGSISYGGDTYIGVGNLLGMTAFIETNKVEANGLSITLTGINSSIISTALGEDYQGRFISCFFACLNSSGALISDPYLLFRGRMDVMEILEAGETTSVTMRCENLLVDFRRRKIRRYTDEDQKTYNPSDKGLEYVDQIQDREIIWGKKSP